MTKTVHPLLSHYSSTKWGEGGGAYLRGGAYFKFRPIGEALIRRGRLIVGGGANLKIYGISVHYV